MDQYTIVGGVTRFTGKADYYRKLHGGKSDKEIIVNSGADKLLSKTLRKKTISSIMAMTSSTIDSYEMPQVDFTIKGGAEEAEYSYAQQAADMEEPLETHVQITYGLFE